MSDLQEVRKQNPDWFYERFYETSVVPGLASSDSMTMEWHIKKPSMIATLNYLRSEKKLKCQWIEKEEDVFMIKIFKP